MENHLLDLAVVVLAIAAIVFGARKIFQRITILEFERGLRYSKGRFKGISGPGQYWIFSYRTSLTKIDVRPTFVPVPGQEVLSSDGVTIKVSLAAKYEVVDPDTAVNRTKDYENELYLHLQLGLREIIGTATIDEVLNRRGEFAKRLLELTEARAQEIGLKLHEVNIKDIMFPGPLKQMFAQVVNARKEGEAALEKARGETAALRNLANAAKLVESNPALLQLRLIQLVGESSGNTVVLGMPPDSTPLPVKVQRNPEGVSDSQVEP
jgi:regulator of protease activity HflC (stomatin/prohibitin superfamily)